MHTSLSCLYPTNNYHTCLDIYNKLHNSDTMHSFFNEPHVLCMESFSQRASHHGLGPYMLKSHKLITNPILSSKKFEVDVPWSTFVAVVHSKCHCRGIVTIDMQWLWHKVNNFGSWQNSSTMIHVMMPQSNLYILLPLSRMLQYFGPYFSKIKYSSQEKKIYRSRLSCILAPSSIQIYISNQFQTIRWL